MCIGTAAGEDWLFKACLLGTVTKLVEVCLQIVPHRLSPI